MRKLRGRTRGPGRMRPRRGNAAADRIEATAFEYEGAPSKLRRFHAIQSDISLRVLPAKCATVAARRLWERATSLIKLSETNFPARPAILL